MVNCELAATFCRAEAHKAEALVGLKNLLAISY